MREREKNREKTLDNWRKKSENNRFVKKYTKKKFFLKQIVTDNLLVFIQWFHSSCNESKKKCATV